MSVCVGRLPLREALRAAAGAYLAGAEPVEGAAPVSVYRVGGEIHLSWAGRVLRLCSEEGCDVVVNLQRGGLYFHGLSSPSGLRKMAATGERADEVAAAGFLAGRLALGAQLEEAWEELLELLEPSSPSLAAGVARRLAEHRCFNRVLDALDRLASREELRGSLEGRVVVACRGAGEVCYLAQCYIGGGYVVVERVRRAWARALPAHQRPGPMEALVCVESAPDYLAGWAQEGPYRCARGKDPVEIVIELEKAAKTGRSRSAL